MNLKPLLSLAGALLLTGLLASPGLAQGRTKLTPTQELSAIKGARGSVNVGTVRHPQHGQLTLLCQGQTLQCVGRKANGETVQAQTSESSNDRGVKIIVKIGPVEIELDFPRKKDKKDKKGGTQPAEPAEPAPAEGVR
jgi:hypothetical protein